LIKNPNDIVERLVADFSDVLGERLIGISMYGSAVSHEFQPGKSDVNLLILLSDTAVAVMQECGPVVTRWMKRGIAAPVIMTPECLGAAQSAFPVEVLDMQHSYRVLCGNDYLAGTSLDRNDLYLQCRRELLGTEMHLKARLAEKDSVPRYLENTMLESVDALLPVFNALLVICGKKIPNVKSEVIASVEDIFGMGVSVFSEIYNRPHQRKDMVTNRYDQLVKAVEVLRSGLEELYRQGPEQARQSEETLSPV
jgi:hypothetical protein